MQHSRKIVFSILVIQIFSFLILMYLGHYQYVTVLDMTIAKKEQDTKQLINSIYENVKQELTAYGNNILLDEEIIKAFADKDREKLFNLTTPIYKNLGQHNKYLSIMHFHTTDNHSFLRLHKPQKYGDSLSQIRPIVVETNSKKRFQSGIEVGKYGLSYRTAFPVFYKNRHVGVLELGVDIKYIISKLSIINISSPLFLINKEAAKPIYEYNKESDRYLSSFSDDYLMLNNEEYNSKEASKALIDDRIIKENSYIKEYNQKEYLVFKSLVLDDYKKNPIGYFIFQHEMNYYMNTITVIRLVSIITTIFIMIVIAFLINKLIKNYIGKINEQKFVLDYYTNYDELTELPNRTLFNEELHKAIKESGEEDKKFALFFLNLDRFKQINDSLGHVIGDSVLKIIASRLQSTIRKDDFISRFAGDEFTVLVKDIKKVEDMSKLAKNILNSLSQPIHTNNHTLYLTNSIGISIYPDDATDVGNLLKNADTAMHKAKEEGKNNFQYYSYEMSELAFERVVMEANLRNALENEEFVVYYQPQIDAKTDKIIGMEALVRWLHPAQGFIYPDKFIPLAQETGLIVEIDRWVMKNAMKQIVKWYKEGLNPGILALNLSMKQLMRDECIKDLVFILNDTECKSKWLELEVTEGEIMKNPESAIEKLKNISDLGIELAVDDFGTGYSSLSYLKKLPIDKLKIDKSFVDGLPDDEEDISIARAIIALSKSLKLSVIAEGVETKEQKDFLIENGCQNIQGYFYAKPMNAKDMQKMLEKNL
mgnify:CR=1 FL=1